MGASITVLRAGPLISIQDGGRYGYRAYGLSTSGPVDRDAHAIANTLVGNEAGAAAIEFALAGGAFCADAEVLIAVTGGACRIEIDGRSVSPWESHRLRAGETLTIGHLQGAVWGYLSISGAIATAPVLGSRATHLRSGVGGLDGRTLAAGDRLPLGPAGSLQPLMLGQPYLRRQAPIPIVPGPQDDYFDAATWTMLLTQPYRVTTLRDRMAMVLEGPRLPAVKGHDIVSDATVPGSIQVPGSGKPIVLTADGQTTGGYPKIATVASAALARLAQMPAGCSVTFRAISADAAEDLFIKAQRRLEKVIESHQPKNAGE